MITPHWMRKYVEYQQQDPIHTSVPSHQHQSRQILIDERVQNSDWLNLPHFLILINVNAYFGGIVDWGDFSHTLCVFISNKVICRRRPIANLKSTITCRNLECSEKWFLSIFNHLKSAMKNKCRLNKRKKWSNAYNESDKSQSQRLLSKAVFRPSPEFGRYSATGFD